MVREDAFILEAAFFFNFRLKEYDEFNVVKSEEFILRFDSKENFDNNYESNWYYYYK